MNRPRRRRLMSEMNVVPYIDVMLVLLIIFMITAPLLTQGINVNLPEAAAQPLDPLRDNEPVVLSIDSEGQYYLNIGSDNEEPISAEIVVERTAAAIRRNAETPVLVKADQAVQHGRVVEGMALLQRAGAMSIGIITNPISSEAE